MFRPLSLRARLMGAFGLALLAFSTALAVNILQLRELGASLEIADHAWLPIGRSAGRMAGQLEKAGSGPVNLTESITAVRTLLQQTSDPLQHEHLAVSDGLRQLEIIEGAERRYNASVGTPGASRASAELEAELDRLSELASRRVGALSSRAARAEERAERTSLIVAPLSMGLALLLGLLIQRALRPVEELTMRARQLQKGETPPPLEVEGEHEVAVLARTFGTMAAAVAERDARLQALTRLQRQVLDQIRAAVALEQEGTLLLSNPASDRLWGTPLPAVLRTLPVGKHLEVQFGARVLVVSVEPFGEKGRLYVGEDVTDDREAALRLARAERLALVGQMLAQVTHEVRNPLNAIGLHVELLADELVEGEAKAMLLTVQQQLGRLEGITERYLDLARPRRAEVRTLDPLELCRDMVRFEAEALHRMGLTVTVTGVGGDLPLDGAALRQILLNLLRNAGEAGANRAELQVKTVPDAAEITVADNGPGMDEETARRIFEPFFSTRARGTGLGLAITRQLVEEAGGQIRCETAPGSGARFLLRIPAAVGEGEE